VLNAFSCSSGVTGNFLKWKKFCPSYISHLHILWSPLFSNGCLVNSMGALSALGLLASSTFPWDLTQSGRWQISGVSHPTTDYSLTCKLLLLSPGPVPLSSVWGVTNSGVGGHAHPLTYLSILCLENLCFCLILLWTQPFWKRVY
jgi:hypothetical protein